MTSRRLCMIVHGSYPLAEPRVTRQARAAVDAGWEVDVVAHRLAGERDEEEIDGVRVIRLPFQHRRGASFGRVLYEYAGFTLAATAKVAALHRARRYAVVQVHNPPDFLMLAALVPRLGRARVFLDVHDFAPDLFELRYGRRSVGPLLVKILRLVEQLAIRAADVVITVHEPYRRALLAKGVPLERTVVVLNSVDEAVLPASRPARDRGFRVVYHGTVTPHYGVEQIVEAFAVVAKQRADAQLEIYGDGDGAEAVRAAIDAHDVGGRVTFIDRYLPHREVLAAIQNASVGVVANLPVERNKPALPTKLLEYVALGVPVVAADLPGIVEHFSAGEMVFYSAGSVRSLADALLAAAADPVAAAERVQRARERYEAYRWPVYAALYTQLLDGATPPRASARDDVARSTA